MYLTLKVSSHDGVLYGRLYSMWSVVCVLEYGSGQNTPKNYKIALRIGMTGFLNVN